MNGRDREVAALVYMERSFRHRYGIADFSDWKIDIPVAEEGDYPYFVLDQAADIRSYYSQNGYVVARRLLPPTLCDRATASFEAEVKPFGGFIYRHVFRGQPCHMAASPGFLKRGGIRLG
jgi:hypothetical protein